MSEMSRDSSTGDYDIGVCDCNKRARIRTSWTTKNPGRRFKTCGKGKEEDGCNFFMWMDDGLSGRAKEVISELSQKMSLAEDRLKFVEEKLKVAEERLKVAEEKLAKKAIKKRMNKAKKQENFVKNCILVVLIAVVVLLLNNRIESDKKYLM